MKQAVLSRIKTSDSGTFGKLVAPGFSCVTGELPWRGNARKLSCIPNGTYSVELRQSPKFGRVYGVRGVPGRSYILIHGGNFSGDVTRGWASHVEGCILLGNRLGRLQNPKGQLQDAVLASRVAVNAFMRAMEYEPFILVVNDVLSPGGK